MARPRSSGYDVQRDTILAQAAAPALTSFAGASMGQGWSDELIATIAECKKVPRYIDMPLQHIAQDMLRSGDWMIPRVGGDLYADKPPVFFWLMAAAMALTGSLRVGFLLPSLLARIGCIVLVYDLLRRVGAATWRRFAVSATLIAF